MIVNLSHAKLVQHESHLQPLELKRTCLWVHKYTEPFPQKGWKQKIQRLVKPRATAFIIWWWQRGCFLPSWIMLSSDGGVPLWYLGENCRLLYLPYIWQREIQRKKVNVFPISYYSQPFLDFLRTLEQSKKKVLLFYFFFSETCCNANKNQFSKTIRFMP